VATGTSCVIGGEIPSTACLLVKLINILTKQRCKSITDQLLGAVNQTVEGGRSDRLQQELKLWLNDNVGMGLGNAIPVNVKFFCGMKKGMIEI
jgi:hypothetical protein